MGQRRTKSKDGRLRADLRVTIRVSPEDLAEMKKVALEEEMPFREWLQMRANDGVHYAVIRHNDEQEGKRWQN